MKKILKSELTPQLVKHQEATLQLRIVQRGAFPLPPDSASVPDLVGLSVQPASITSSDHEN